MSNWLLPARAMVIQSTNKLELHTATEWVCEQSRFRFDEQMTYEENAELARRQEKFKVAEIFSLAQVRFDSIERCK
jgi:hypothetical protein